MNRYAFPPTIPGALAHLCRCRAARAVGHRVSYTTDPAWLVHMAINRRAGWPDDPTTTRGSAAPTSDGRYPPKAAGSGFAHLRRLSREINTPRLIVREGALGEWRALLKSRLPHRFRMSTED